MRLFLDSRFATVVGESTWEFEVPPDAMHVESEGTRYWLQSWTGTVSLDNIDSTTNRLYLVENGVLRIVEIPHGAYDIDSLVTALSSLLNTGKEPSMGTYSVVRTSSGGSPTTGAAFSFIKVSCSSGSFRIPSSDAQIEAFFGAGASAQSSTNRIFSFPTGDVSSGSHTSSFFDGRRAHALYIHSNLTDYSSVGPSGERSIIATVPVVTGYGSLLHHQLTSSAVDPMKLGCRSITRIRISIKDAYGSTFDWKGGHWSATLVFDDALR